MFVGVLRARFTIPGARTLKDKRRVVQSFKERTINRFRVSVAEVGELDNPRYATLGVAVVANEASHCDSVLADVAAVAANLPDAILAERTTEIVPFGFGGRGLTDRGLMDRDLDPEHGVPRTAEDDNNRGPEHDD